MKVNNFMENNIVEKIIGIFCAKELLLGKLWMSYYPEPYSHVTD